MKCNREPHSSRRWTRRFGRMTLVAFLALYLWHCGSDDRGPVFTDVRHVDVVAGEGQSGGDTCMSKCEGLECGPDRCGGSCGVCSFQLESCEDGVCVSVSCQTTLDCPGQLVCSPQKGICVICADDTDCPDGQVCGPHDECHEELECTSDLDCKVYGLLCDKSSGVCVHCLSGDECEEESYCLEGFCVSDVCTAGQNACEDNSIVTCTSDGAGWEHTLKCESGQFCDNGECLSFACEPGLSWCDDGLFAECSPDGKSVLQEVDCKAIGMNCTPTGCFEGVCMPLTAFCVDFQTKGLCANDGTSYEEIPCPEEHFCEEGLCLPWICQPGHKSCEDNHAVVCNPQGSGVEQKIDCGDQSCIDGECVSCVPDCGGKECGNDSCGGECGTCGAAILCNDGVCDGCDDGNTTAWDGCTNGAVSEFHVNDTVSGIQQVPQVASSSSGAFVVVWSQSSPDTAMGKLFLPDGVELAGEFALASGSTGTTKPVVARVGADRFVAIWQETGSSHTIRGQRFDFQGGTVGEAFAVSDELAGSHQNPRVSATGDGQFTVVWTQIEQGLHVWGRAYGLEGESMGPKFRVNEVPDANHNSVLMIDQQNAVVAWRQLASQPGAKGDLKMAVVDVLTGEVGSSLDPNNEPKGDQSEPAVGAFPDGQIVVTWMTDDSSQTKKHVAARWFDAQFDPIGGSLLLSSYGGNQWSPAVTALSDGRIMAVWYGTGGEDGYGVYMKPLESNGTIAEDEILVNSYKEPTQQRPAIAAFDAGGFIVVWHAEMNNWPNDWDSKEIFAQRFAADFSKVVH